MFKKFLLNKKYSFDFNGNYKIDNIDKRTFKIKLSKNIPIKNWNIKEV